MNQAATSSDYVCPACRIPVARAAEAYRCAGCGRDYPILFGIPDFRLKPDAYLSIEDERAKAARLVEYGETSDFAGMVAHYYAITDDVPPEIAPRFAAYVHGGPARSAPILARLGTAPQAGRLLDLGCGSGGALVAAAPLYAERTGVDIALRWLVIAQKRLEELGIEARLVCADAEALPFPSGCFSHVLADDLIDNVRSPALAIENAARVLGPGGRLWLSATNSRWIGPHPATGLWAVGLVPRAWRAEGLKRRYGYDLLRAIALHTPATLARFATRAGLRKVDAGPKLIAAAQLSGRPLAVRLAVRSYLAAAYIPGLRSLIRALGPAFEMLYRKPIQDTGAST